MLYLSCPPGAGRTCRPCRACQAGRTGSTCRACGACQAGRTGSTCRACGAPVRPVVLVVSVVPVVPVRPVVLVVSVVPVVPVVLVVSVVPVRPVVLVVPVVSVVPLSGLSCLSYLSCRRACRAPVERAHRSTQVAGCAQKRRILTTWVPADGPVCSPRVCRRTGVLTSSVSMDRCAHPGCIEEPVCSP